MLDIYQLSQCEVIWRLFSSHLCLSVAKSRWGSSILVANNDMQWYCAWPMQYEKYNSSSTYGYIAIVVSLTKISLLGTSTVLQVKAWGGGILCFLQNSAGEILYSCLTSCKSDFAATTKHGILLSMKCCCKFKEKKRKKQYMIHSTWNSLSWTGCSSIKIHSLHRSQAFLDAEYFI